MDPSSISQVVINGYDLTLSQLVAVARHRIPTQLDPPSKIKIGLCRKVVDVLLESGPVAYGITTGFGALRDKSISLADTQALQKNLIRSHACGVGRPFSEEVVRAAIVLRANTLAKGHSGIRPVVVEKLLEMANLGLYPYVPEQGSLGASGDLAPLSHLGLVLMGDPDGRFYPGGESAIGEKDLTRDDFIPSTRENLQKHGFTPIDLQAKEGLAVNNGTTFITALAALTLHDSKILLKSAEVALALSLEAIRGVTDVLDPQLYQIRPHHRQEVTAQSLRNHLKNSEILDHPLNTAFLHRFKAELGQLLKMAPDGLSGQLEHLGEALDKMVDKGREVSRDWTDETTYKEKVDSIFPLLHPHKEELHRLIQSLLKSELDRPTQSVVQYLVRLHSYLHQCLPIYRPVQDNYSFRCGLQILAAGYHTWKHVSSIVEVELNAACDNPLIFPPNVDEYLDRPDEYESFLRDNIALAERAVISGGNFHGEPLALALDYLAMSLSEVASISERRVAQLTDGTHNNGLPPFLTHDPGLNSGWMIPQYTAANLVSENKTLSHPASVDTIPTSANTEDHVSMGCWAARKCRDIFVNVRQVVAVEILSAAQGLAFRTPFQPGETAQKVQKILAEADCGPIGDDEPLYIQMEKVDQLVAQGKLCL